MRESRSSPQHVAASRSSSRRSAPRPRPAACARAEGARWVATLPPSGAELGGGARALRGGGGAGPALPGWAGFVPLIRAVPAPAVSGPALLLGLADLVVMTDEAF